MSAASIDGVLLLVVVVLLHTPALLGQKLEGDRADLDTLKFVHALWRHGDRTPTKMIPSDQTNTLDKWTVTFGGLGLFSSDSQKGPKMPLEENAPKGLELHLLPRGHDPILFDDVECPAASKAEDELFSSDDFKKEEEKNAKLLFLGHKTQYGQVPHPLRRIYYVHDPLNSINAHKKDGFVLPDWVRWIMVGTNYLKYVHHRSAPVEGGVRLVH